MSKAQRQSTPLESLLLFFSPTFPCHPFSRNPRKRGKWLSIFDDDVFSCLRLLLNESVCRPSPYRKWHVPAQAFSFDVTGKCFFQRDANLPPTYSPLPEKAMLNKKKTVLFINSLFLTTLPILSNFLVWISFIEHLLVRVFFVPRSAFRAICLGKLWRGTPFVPLEHDDFRYLSLAEPQQTSMRRACPI